MSVGYGGFMQHKWEALTFIAVVFALLVVYAGSKYYGALQVCIDKGYAPLVCREMVRPW